MSCILNLVGLGVCDDNVSLSGFMLTQAGGMSLNNFASIANETYTNGISMAMQKKELAALQLKTDFLSALQSNEVVTQIAIPEYEACIFNSNINLGTYAGDRGIVIHKNNNWRGGLRKTKIKQVEVYPLASGDSTISIIDGNRTYTWDVELVANEINVFTSEQLSGLPYVMQSQSVSVLIDQTTIPFGSTEIICRTGCNDTVPNDCGWVEGWTGTTQIKSEGYGMNVVFYCECDYEQIICSNPLVFGELFWIKWQMLIFDEQFKTNRFNDLVIYTEEKIDQIIIPELRDAYISKWQNVTSGLKGILNQYKDSCLNCQGIRFVTNL